MGGVGERPGEAPAVGLLGLNEAFGAFGAFRASEALEV